MGSGAGWHSSAFEIITIQFKPQMNADKHGLKIRNRRRRTSVIAKSVSVYPWLSLPKDD
jgi:hypothetical protein